MSSLRDRILNAKDIKTEAVTVDEWGDDSGPATLNVVGLSAGQRLTIIKQATVTEATTNGKGEPVKEEKVDNGLLYPLLIIAAVRDPETNQPLFTAGDADALMGKSAGVIERLGADVLRVSGMTKETQAALQKNSAPTPSDAGVTA